MIANAVIDIWKAEGVFPVPKYEDDLKVFRTPLPTGTFHEGDFSYDYDCADMLRCIAPLGVGMKKSATTASFSSQLLLVSVGTSHRNSLVSLKTSV